MTSIHSCDDRWRWLESSEVTQNRRLDAATALLDVPLRRVRLDGERDDADQWPYHD